MQQTCDFLAKINRKQLSLDRLLSRLWLDKESRCADRCPVNGSWIVQPNLTGLFAIRTRKGQNLKRLCEGCKQAKSTVCYERGRCVFSGGTQNNFWQQNVNFFRDLAPDEVNVSLFLFTKIFPFFQSDILISYQLKSSRNNSLCLSNSILSPNAKGCEWSTLYIARIIQTARHLKLELTVLQPYWDHYLLSLPN